MEVTEKKREAVYFRVEGELLPISSARIAFHFARNAQAFTERVYRLLAVGGTALLRPIVTLVNPEFATRLLHLPLRGMSRDRLDLLGEEFFHYVLRPQVNPNGAEQIERLKRQDRHVVLVSQELEHLIRPLADSLKVESLLANRLEFRDDLATGRLLDPVIPPRVCLAEKADRNRPRRGDERMSTQDFLIWRLSRLRCLLLA